MSKYITLSSDYHVLCLNENGEIEKQLQADDPVFEKAIGKMIESFNEARLERYLDDDMAKKCLGYTVKDEIRFICMQFVGKKDECGNPYVKIIVETYPRALVMTMKVRAFLDDYLSAQFCCPSRACSSSRKYALVSAVSSQVTSMIFLTPSIITVSHAW